MTYERLKQQASQQGIDIYEEPMKPTIKGLYADQVIWINRNLPTDADKACVVAEELGHYYTSTGDILDQSKLQNRKQEQRARTWAYQSLVPLSRIVQAYKTGISGRHDLAEFLGVTEDFLEATIDRYREKYGLCATYERYTIYFEPLGVVESFE